jgi:hypothetical protein
MNAAVHGQRIPAKECFLMATPTDMSYADLVIACHNVDELALSTFSAVLMDSNGRPYDTTEFQICDISVSTRL